MHLICFGLPQNGSNQMLKIGSSQGSNSFPNNIKTCSFYSNINGSKLGLVPINYIKLLKKFNAVGEEIEERK
jgi:hypothetical protein